MFFHHGALHLFDAVMEHPIRTPASHCSRSFDPQNLRTEKKDWTFGRSGPSGERDYGSVQEEPGAEEACRLRQPEEVGGPEHRRRQAERKYWAAGSSWADLETRDGHGGEENEGKGKVKVKKLFFFCSLISVIWAELWQGWHSQPVRCGTTVPPTTGPKKITGLFIFGPPVCPPVHRSRPGLDRRPNTKITWTEDRTDVPWSDPI